MVKVIFDMTHGNLNAHEPSKTYDCVIPEPAFVLRFFHGNVCRIFGYL